MRMSHLNIPCACYRQAAIPCEMYPLSIGLFVTSYIHSVLQIIRLADYPFMILCQRAMTRKGI